MVYRDRLEAAGLLARALAHWRGSRPVIVAIPRGAVPMAAAMAEQLHADLDVVLVRKLRAPGNPELALGAVDETGWTYIGDHARSTIALGDYLAREAAKELALMHERRARYTPDRGPLDVHSRVVIVVDDGLATGSTMIAALHGLRTRGPERLICAIPVASREALSLVRPYADDVACLDVPDFFYAVGQAYEQFPQVSDDEVVEALRRFDRLRATRDALPSV